MHGRRVVSHEKLATFKHRRGLPQGQFAGERDRTRRKRYQQFVLERDVRRPAHEDELHREALVKGIAELREAGRGPSPFGVGRTDAEGHKGRRSSTAGCDYVGRAGAIAVGQPQV
jgi:hypothetical protein